MEETIAWAEATPSNTGLNPGELIELAHTLPEYTSCIPISVRSTNGEDLAAHGYVSANAWIAYEDEIVSTFKELFKKWKNKEQSEMVGSLKNGLRVVLSFDTHPEHLRALEALEGW